MFKEHGTYTHLIQVKGPQGLRGKDAKNPQPYLRLFFPPPKKKSNLRICLETGIT